MKIAVVGAGAMGSIFGARFHQAGHETVLVDVAQPIVDTINTDGVTVVRGDDETVTRVPATTEPATIAPLLDTYLERFPRAARALGAGPRSEQDRRAVVVWCRPR
jgi:glycerol-3-phosphate dehydrogenase